MSYIYEREDLRIIKTHKALISAMEVLLEKRNFMRITVNDLCIEAQISRATFYTHFMDKYDLLKYWLINMRIEVSEEPDPIRQMEMILNHYAVQKFKVIRNLVINANGETIKILHEFLVSIINEAKEKRDEKGTVYEEGALLPNFCAAGIIYFLQYNARNKDIDPMPLGKIVDYLLEYDVD